MNSSYCRKRLWTTNLHREPDEEKARNPAPMPVIAGQGVRVRVVYFLSRVMTKDELLGIIRILYVHCKLGIITFLRLTTPSVVIVNRSEWPYLLYPTLVRCLSTGQWFYWSGRYGNNCEAFQGVIRDWSGFQKICIRMLICVCIVLARGVLQRSRNGNPKLD